MSEFEYEGEDFFEQQDEDDIFHDTIDLGFSGDENENGDEQEEEGLGVSTWIVERKQHEASTTEQLQDMEQTRINLLYYGEQFDVLPHMRCFNCEKIIGHLWEPYIEYTKEKAYSPEEVIDLLDTLSEEEKQDLKSSVNDPIFFEDLLLDYDVKEDYDALLETRKYTNKEIFDNLLKIKPCCRQLFMGPIHVPIQQSAFQENQKLIDLPSTLLNVNADMMDISLQGESIEAMQEEFESNIPLIPEIEIEEPEESCSMPVPLKMMSAAKLGDLTTEDLEVLGYDAVNEIGEATIKRKDLIPVGEQYEVPQQPRVYRAR